MVEYKKLYEDLVDRIKTMAKAQPLVTKKAIEMHFPEIVESEDEDERVRKAIYNCVRWFDFDSCFFKDVSQEECLAWIDKQGEKGTNGNNEEIPNSEPPLTIKHAREVMGIKQDDAWSEEDEKMLDKVIKRLHKYSASDEEYLDKYYWLKEIKHRIQPQNHWNPSEEQMDSLQTAVSSLQSTALESLYQDLKRL